MQGDTSAHFASDRLYLPVCLIRPFLWGAAEVDVLARDEDAVEDLANRQLFQLCGRAHPVPSAGDQPCRCGVEHDRV